MLTRCCALLLAASTLGAGCGSTTEPEEERVVGFIIGFFPDAPHIVVPDTVRAGEEFTVTVRTYWPNGCARRDDTEVEIEELDATITPYDIDTKGEICGAAVEVFTHAATLRFGEPGTARVIIRGREFAGRSLVTIERALIVR